MTENLSKAAAERAMIVIIKKLETLPAGTKPRTSQHRSPGGERRGKRKR